MLNTLETQQGNVRAVPFPMQMRNYKGSEKIVIKPMEETAGCYGSRLHSKRVGKNERHWNEPQAH